MVTPFDREQALDLPRAAELAVRLVDEGSEGLIVNGTTGESPTLSRDERVELFDTVVSALGTSAKVVANIGDNCTEDSVAFARRVAARGVDGLMAVTPYYNKPPQEGLYQHFRAIAAAVDLPVILYNIPGRCVINIEPETICRLANDVENIVAVKQANADLSQVDAIVAGTPETFEVLSGDDALTLPLMERGGVGIISTAGNIASAAFKAMIDAYLAGEYARAQAIDEALRPLEDVLFITSNPIMVKKALELRGFPVGGLRLPLIEANEEQTSRLQTVMTDTCARLSPLLS
jgi:4-hydroxy-tetrahydrodipicolinate synthase